MVENTTDSKQSKNLFKREKQQQQNLLHIKKNRYLTIKF